MAWSGVAAPAPAVGGVTVAVPGVAVLVAPIEGNSRLAWPRVAAAAVAEAGGVLTLPCSDF